MSKTIFISDTGQIIIEPTDTDEDSVYTLQKKDIDGNWVDAGGAPDFVKAIAEETADREPLNEVEAKDDSEMEWEN